MSNYSVYLVEEPHEDDFYREIDPRRLKLIEKHLFENGREVAVESYQDGELISRSESRFNEQGLEAETLEFSGTETTPFKVVRREFNEKGLVTVAKQYFDGEESHVEKNVYDSLGRLLQVAVKGDEGEDVAQTFTYKGDCPLPESHNSNWPQHDAHETRFVNIKVKGEYKVSEEHLTHKKDKYLSRITKYYWNDELPNNVFERIFNAAGKLLEECRETVDEKGNPVQRSWHLNSDADCEPHKYSLFEYDEAQGISREDYFENGLRTYINIWQYDAGGKLLRRYTGLDPHDSLEIYKYED